MRNTRGTSKGNQSTDKRPAAAGRKPVASKRPATEKRPQQIKRVQQTKKQSRIATNENTLTIKSK